MAHDLALNLGPLLCYTYIFFSKIQNIDNYQSFYVKVSFIKDTIFYNTSLL